MWKISKAFQITFTRFLLSPGVCTIWGTSNIPKIAPCVRANRINYFISITICLEKSWSMVTAPISWPSTNCSWNSWKKAFKMWKNKSRIYLKTEPFRGEIVGILGLPIMVIVMDLGLDMSQQGCQKTKKLNGGYIHMIALLLIFSSKIPKF